jgi:hypothetical protein
MNLYLEPAQEEVSDLRAIKSYLDTGREPHNDGK